MTALVKYEAARAALQAAHDVDEVKDIRDKAQAMAAYAKQAKDTKLVEWASEIKVRAERRAGSMLSEMKINGGRHDGRHPENLREYPEVTPGGTIENIEYSETTLETLGVSKKQSSQWQKVASIPEEKFERALTQTKETPGGITTAAVLRSAIRPAKSAAAPKPAKPPTESKPSGHAEKLEARMKEMADELAAGREAHAETKDALAEMTMLAESAKAFEDKTEFKDMQVLRLELKSCKRRRDELMAENAEMKKMLGYWKKKAEKK